MPDLRPLRAERALYESGMAAGEAIAEFERDNDAGPTDPDGGSGSVDS
ncbi:MAG TPA: hypothetical protein VKI00_23070 [Mycobacterium sp.]|nr:hypothetical protein [Mycobacterium sp.]HME78422.1 hypothetical protein [Mycobacterium sp.]